MKDTNKVITRMDAEQVESSETLDDGTRQVLDEYSRKFLSFIQQEKERIRKQALGESEKLLAEADRKGRKAYEETLQQANQEASALISHCTEHANHIFAEAERLFQVVIELRDKTQRDLDEVRERLQRDADVLVAAIQQTNKAIAESRTGLAREFEASAAAITQALHELRPATDEIVEQKPVNQTIETVTPKAATEPAAPAPPRQHEDASKRQSDKSFVGTLNFEIDKGSAAVYRRFKEALSKVPGLEISLAEDSSKDKARIVAFASRPILLMNILHQMSLVKSVTAEKGTIEVMLQEADRWVG